MEKSEGNFRQPRIKIEKVGKRVGGLTYMSSHSIRFLIEDGVALLVFLLQDLNRAFKE